MTNKRSSTRKRIFKAGSISFAYAAGIDCTIRNISDDGAMLEVESIMGIPDDFKLLNKTDRILRDCHVIWRQAKRLGVQFI